MWHTARVHKLFFFFFNLQNRTEIHLETLKQEEQNFDVYLLIKIQP